MRLLIGTLYTNENEFNACLASIRRQTHHDIEHVIIRDLPNKLAHETLYQLFMDRASDFDLFVKIDADMVLIHDDFLEKIVARFATTPSMNALIVSVQDYFSDRLIEGLHTYRSHVHWERHDDQVFVDRASLPKDQIVYDRDNLAPAAQHCPDPSPFQAFHYGVHKGVKVQAALRNHRPGTARFHMTNIESTYAHYRRNGDQRLGLACLGAELALRGVFKSSDINHGNTRIKEQLTRYESLSLSALRRRVTAWRYRNASPLGAMARAKWLTDGTLRCAARGLVPERLHPWMSQIQRACRRPRLSTEAKPSLRLHDDYPQKADAASGPTAVSEASDPMVTWLLPVRNAMPYLPATLESIAQQTYSRFRVVAWDNGSTDGSAKVLQDWIPHRLPGRVVTNRPMSLGQSLAEMVRAAQSELCARIDGDDINLAHRLERQVRFMREHPRVGVVGANMRFMDEHDHNLPGAWDVWTDDAEIRWRLRFCNALNHPTVMFRRSTALAAGNYRDWKPGQDYDLWLRMARLTRMENLPNCLVRYRRHAATVAAQHKGQSADVNTSIARANAGVLFPSIPDEQAMRLRRMGTFNPDQRASLWDGWSFRHAAVVTARALGESDGYFLQTRLYQIQQRYLVMRWVKSLTRSSTAPMKLFQDDQPKSDTVSRRKAA